MADMTRPNILYITPDQQKASATSVLENRGRVEPSWLGDLRRRLDHWEQQCTRLREQLGVVPGNRGFDMPYRPFREKSTVFV